MEEIPLRYKTENTTYEGRPLANASFSSVKRFYNDTVIDNRNRHDLDKDQNRF